jgi:ABC-type multidrug transport system fused ATPase/permease subunit
MTLGSFFRFIWKVSGRQQLLLAALAIAVFLLDLAPLELQRRTINDALKHAQVHTLIVLSLLYVAAVLAQSLAKLAFNVYRGAVTEKVNRHLRLQTDAAARQAPTRSDDAVLNEGIEISIVVSEVEAIGGFVGLAISEPVLHGGVLLSVFAYMLYLQPWMALVAFVLFAPQVIFIPVLQGAINRRTQKRIQVLRALSADIVREGGVDGGGARQSEQGGDARAGIAYRDCANEVYDLNMQIYRRKYGMNFLMNLLYHLTIIGILLVGGWFVAVGRTEVGTVVAFLSGLNRLNDPWGDLVNYFREMTNARVKFRLIDSVLRRQSAEPPAAGGSGT